MDYITSRKTFPPLACLLAILLSGPQPALAENETISQILNIQIFDDSLVANLGQFSAKIKIKKQFSKIRIFGDSLVDTGNLPPVTWPTGIVMPPSTRYDRGRFSNGLLAVEHFSNRFEINVIPSINGVNLDDKGINWGVGGSTTAMSNLNPGGLLVAGLLGQITEYEGALDAAGLSEEKTTKKDEKPLFILWTAHNNYYIPLFTGAIPDENTVLEAVADISTAVTRLHARGATLIVVANMINLGLPPICQIIVGDGICDLLSDLTTDHNAALAEAMNTLETDLEKLKIIQFNVYEIFEDIFENPNNYGFTEASLDEFGPASGCLFDPTNPANCSLVDFRNGNIPWWDELHPSASIHKILGNALHGTITKKLKN